MYKGRGQQVPITPYSKEYLHIVDMLRKSFVPQRGIPLCLSCSREGKQSIYTAATTATALLSLHYIGKLDDHLRRDLQEAVFILKSGSYDAAIPAESQAQQEARVAWDVLEGASTWTTSLAIWALLATGYNGQRLGEINRATLWVVDQQENGGWGRYADDVINFFTTGFVLHALKLALSHAVLLNFTEAELRKIKRARTNAFKSIRAAKQTSGRTVYWEIDTEKGNVADPTSTLCAIWALHEAGEDAQDGDTDLIAKGIAYLKDALQQDSQPGHAHTWSFRQVVHTAPVHGPTMSIVSFTPSFVIPLLAMKYSPFDSICLAPIEWLQQNRLPNGEGWGHLNFGHAKGHSLSFTTSYALWSISNWYKYASISIQEQQVQVRSLKWQRNLLLGLLIIMSISLLLPLLPISQFFPSIQHLYKSMLGFNDQLQFLWTIISIAVATIAVLKWIDSILFRNTLAKFIRQVTQRFRGSI